MEEKLFLSTVEATIYENNTDDHIVATIHSLNGSVVFFILNNVKQEVFA
jgi:hypothetical protein